MSSKSNHAADIFGADLNFIVFYFKLHLKGFLYKNFRHTNFVYMFKWNFLLNVFINQIYIVDVAVIKP